MMDEDWKKTIKKFRNRQLKPERDGEYWDDDEKQKLDRMFSEGAGVSEIAVELQRSEPAVMQQIEKQDLFERKQYPQRSPRRIQPPDCLCRCCKVDKALCPICKLYYDAEEAD